MKSKHQILVTAISFLLVLLFTYAAISKLMDYHRFTSQLHHSPILKPVAGILTWLIPSVELYIAVLLIVGEWRKSGLLYSSILMMLFTLYITIMLTSFETIPCSCGGVFERMSWHQHLIFNTIITILSFLALTLQYKLELPNESNPVHPKIPKILLKTFIRDKSGNAENL